MCSVALFPEYEELRDEVVRDDDHDLSEELDDKAVDVQEIDTYIDDHFFQ